MVHAGAMVIIRSGLVLGAVWLALSSSGAPLLGSTGGSTGQRPGSPFAVGELFPDLAFPALEDGAPTRMSRFRGKKVMLHVFASW